MKTFYLRSVGGTCMSMLNSLKLWTHLFHNGESHVGRESPLDCYRISECATILPETSWITHLEDRRVLRMFRYSAPWPEQINQVREGENYKAMGCERIKAGVVGGLRLSVERRRMANAKMSTLRYRCVWTFHKRFHSLPRIDNLQRKEREDGRLFMCSDACDILALIPRATQSMQSITRSHVNMK